MYLTALPAFTGNYIWTIDVAREPSLSIRASRGRSPRRSMRAGSNWRRF